MGGCAPRDESRSLESPPPEVLEIRVGVLSPVVHPLLLQWLGLAFWIIEFGNPPLPEVLEIRLVVLSPVVQPLLWQ